jgi:general secretion pathway protein D
MFRIRLSLCLVLLGVLAYPLVAESPESSYKKGVRAEAKKNLDVAFEAYKQAHEKRPADPKYMAAYLRIRAVAAAKHVEAGEQLRDFSKLQEALAEFRLAVQIDGSNFAAQQDMRRTADLIQKQTVENDRPPRQKAEASAIQKAAANAGGPIVLAYDPATPISLHLITTADVIYKTIGKVAGLNVLIDPDYKPQKVNFELKDVSIREALGMIAMQSKTFWQPVSPNTIMVSPDNGGKRKEFEQNVMMTFYLQNAATPADLQQAAATLKSILDITRIQTTPDQRSLTIRGTPDQMVLAQKLLTDIDKPKAEVMIEVAVLEVSRDKIRTIGVNPPTSVSATLAPGGTSSTSSTGTSSGSGFTLNSLAAITANNIQISVPGASLSFLMSDSNTKVIQKPQIRAMDSEKATLKIGDRIPIATGSYQSGISNGVNTQFQYIDVGVTIDITPYVHGNTDVTLKMALEISSVTGEQSIDGVTEPTIGQRRIEHQARLADGEVNLIGGILEDTESKSLSGYPWLTKIPLLKYLFGQENKERQQNEIIFAITPHIIRSNEITDENMRMVDIGTANSVTYRKVDAANITPKPAAAQTPPDGRPAVPVAVPAGSNSPRF